MSCRLQRRTRCRTGRRLLGALVSLLLMAGLSTVPSASAAPVNAAAPANLNHPRQEWLRASTAGLFLHWGMFTAPRHLDCAEWERDVTGGGWTPDYWVDEARKLGASYIVLATFHSRLGYARPWPSSIPGSCRTERDILGELVKAGNAKNVKIILYMTDDPQWHSELGKQTLDSAAYSAYKGKQVDLTTRRGFGMYSYDLFHEVMDRYEGLAGFWIDNDNEYWEENHLYEQVRERRPSWLLSNNNEDTPIMDTVSNEQKTGMTPSYDYPQAAWTPMPRLVEADYKLPTTGDWWYDGDDHPVDFRLSTGRYITNAGSSMKSLMAETPMVNGKFPPGQEKFNNFMAEWVPPLKESLHGTEGGGYMYGGMQPGFWNDGAHGVVTIKPGGRTQYVHVVTKPTTDMVRMRDNGYWVTRVTDVRTGERLKFNQSGGYLSILGVTNWDTYDTVFKVDTLGQQLYYDQSTVEATTSSSKAGFPAENLADGNFETNWDSNAQLPVSVTLDLKQRKHATYLAVNQREWSPTYARVSFGRPEDSARIKDYRVSVSDDGVRWRQVRASAMPSARGTQFVDIGEQQTRYIKLDVLNTWGGPQAPRYFNELQIDEIKVAYGSPLYPWAQVPLEAEHASRNVSLCWACSGTLQVKGPVTFRDVTVATAGDYRLELNTTSPEATSVAVSINGAAPVTVSIPADRPDVPTPTAIPVSLRAGANTVALSGGAGIDRIAVAPLPPASYVPTTTMTVQPHGIQWLGPDQRSVKVTAGLRLDVDSPVDTVKLTPVVPAGWTLQGDPASTPALRLGQILSGTWTLTSNQPVTQATIPVTASFQVLGRAKQVTTNVQVRPRPADRIFMREAEDSANKPGSTGLTSCGPCSGGEKVRNIGGATDAFVQFDDVTVAAAGQYKLFVDYTVNGPRSFFVSVNGGPPTEMALDGLGNNTPYTAAIPITLQAGANTIKMFNDRLGAPDLDRISVG